MTEELKNTEFKEGKQVVISLDDIDEETSLDELREDRLIELQLTMATTSINHEYAKIEYEESKDYERREELLAYMTDCRAKYLTARGELANYNPIALEKFEKDLIIQKMTTITHYHA